LKYNWICIVQFGMEEKGEGEEKMCRICHGGEEEGRLISPCKCKGTMKHVHISCLDKWRRVSQNSSSYFKCDSCNYQYSFRRTTFSQVFKSPFVLQLTTFVIFLCIIITCGYVWITVQYLVSDEEDRQSTSFWWIDLYHLLCGSILLGTFGFFQIHLFFPLFRFPGNGRSSIELVIFAVIVFIGLVKMFISVYGLVKTQTQKLLSKMEDMVLEV